MHLLIQSVIDLKLSRYDRVYNIAGADPTVKLRSKPRETNPLVFPPCFICSAYTNGLLYNLEE